MVDLYDLIGLIGVAFAIFCYARVQWQRDYAKRLSYSLLNLVASLFIIVSLLHKWNVAAFVSNTIWALISLYGIYRCLKYMRKSATVTLKKNN
jgi:hypothetical protein